MLQTLRNVDFFVTDNQMLWNIHSAKWTYSLKLIYYETELILLHKLAEECNIDSHISEIPVRLISKLEIVINK